MHKAAGLTVHGRSTGLPGIIPKISKEATIQNALQRLLYDGRLYGGFVNSAINVMNHIMNDTKDHNIVDDIVNDKKGQNIVNDSFAPKPDGLLVTFCVRMLCHQNTRIMCKENKL